MRICGSRILSVVVTLALLAAAVVHDRQFSVQTGELALALIWFPEPIGEATGFIGHGPITASTPPFLVAAAGWCMLLGIPILMWYVG